MNETVPPVDEVDASRAPLMEHLIELRTRLIWSFMALVVASIIGFYFSGQVFDFLTRPLAQAFHANGQKDARLIYTQLYGAFITKLKLGFFTGVFIAFPIVANQIWLFVAPGLYKREKRAVLPFLIATPVLFTMGAALCYYVVMPNAFHFFLSFQKFGGPSGLSQEALPDMNEYLTTVMHFILAFGFAFLLPILLVLLVRAGIIELATLRRNRRYAIFIVFAVAAIITPPDALSMLSLALPLWALYELTIIVLHLTRPRPATASTIAEISGE